jgi:signal transduction histidine kinase
MPTTGWHSAIGPVVVSSGLLFLVIARQAVAFLENEQTRRERDTAQTTTLVLREANRQMSAFLAIASHELKTPLTSLQGNIDVLIRRLKKARQAGDEAEVDPLVSTIDMALPILDRCKVSLRRVGGLVDDLLDDSRIHEDRLAMRLECCDLAGVVESAVMEQRLLAGDRTISLEVPATRPIPVHADPNRVGQVVTNYLTNALKYSPEDRPVTVCLEVDGDQARVSVRDEGQGLRRGEQARIWERFYRAPDVEVQSGSGIGLGIGLHISKSIIDAHHGTVGVRSVAGHGSTFWFTLPLAESPLACEEEEEPLTTAGAS